MTWCGSWSMRTWRYSRGKRHEIIWENCRDFLRTPQRGALPNHAERVIRLRHLCRRSKFGDYGSQRRIDNRYLGAGADVTIKVDDVDRTHANAAIACGPADVSFFRRAMNVNVSSKRIPVSRFHPAQPNDSRYNRIATGRIHGDDFTSSASIFKHRSWRRAVADLVRDFEFAERGAVTTRSIAQAEF